MSAQRPGKHFAQSSEPLAQPLLPSIDSESWAGTRSFVFYSEDTKMRYDYLTQQLPSSSLQVASSRYPKPEAELMFGGGFMQGGVNDTAFFHEIGNWDDSDWNPRVISYVSGALVGPYFDPVQWGAEGAASKDEPEQFAKGRVKMVWSGVMGYSADGMPWVGRVPESVAGRSAPRTLKPSASASQESFFLPDRNITVDASSDSDSESEHVGATYLAKPGEWISAGYSGEGMAHAWMCGKALAYMILGKDSETASSAGAATSKNTVGILTDYARDKVLDNMTPDNLSGWFPNAFRITEERWRKAKIEDLL
jgi:hypothetical protein